MLNKTKFRAWDNVERKMYYTGEEDLILFMFDSTGIVAEKIVPDDSVEEYNAEVLHHLIYMQSTERKDVDGADIYSGDIVEQITIISNFHKVIRGVVRFIDGCYMVESVDGTGGNYLFDECSVNKVLGNVYEDPELLLTIRGEMRD